MADLEKKNSQNLSSTPNDDFLDWNEYDEEYEEDDINDIQKESTHTESKTTNQKDSEEIDDEYNEVYNKNTTNKDYIYQNNTYRGKKYPSYYNNRGGFVNKRFNKQSKPFRGGYDNNSYYNRGSYYKRRQNNDNYNSNKDFFKYNKDYNYESKREYKTMEKEYDYDSQNRYDKKTDRSSFADRHYGKKYNYSSRYKNNDYSGNKNTPSYSTREFIDDDKKYNNRNNKYKKEYKGFTEAEEEEIKEKNDEVISKPQFFNSKIGNNEETQVSQQKYIKTGDFILTDNLVNAINKIVKDTYINLKKKISKNIEDQYGSLNINAQTYIPKKKKLKENNIINNNLNYEPGFDNNNINPQNNYMPPYI